MNDAQWERAIEICRRAIERSKRENELQIPRGGHWVEVDGVRFFRWLNGRMTNITKI